MVAKENEEVLLEAWRQEEQLLIEKNIKVCRSQQLKGICTVVVSAHIMITIYSLLMQSLCTALFVAVTSVV